MAKLTMLHNQSCSKSKHAFGLLESLGFRFDVRDYLNDPLSKVEIEDLLVKLDLEPTDIIRKKEDLYINEFKGKELSNEEWVNVLVKHPNLIERPIVVSEDNGVIGRPLMHLEDFLQEVSTPATV